MRPKTITPVVVSLHLFDCGPTMLEHLVLGSGKLGRLIVGEPSTQPLYFRGFPAHYRADFEIIPEEARKFRWEIPKKKVARYEPYLSIARVNEPPLFAMPVETSLDVHAGDILELTEIQGSYPCKAPGVLGEGE